MPLSEINIHASIQEVTSSVIESSQYEELRTSILARQAIPQVMTNITQLLSNFFQADKEFITRQLTNEACEAQNNSDLHDTEIIKQEKERDDSLQTSLVHARLNLETATRISQSKYYEISDFRSQLHLFINEHKTTLKGIEAALNLIRKERNLLNAQSHSPQDQSHLDNLNQEESRLVVQQSNLSTQIHNKETACSSVDTDLTKISKELEEIDKQIKEIQHQFKVELPEKEHQRKIRQQEIAARHAARQSSAPLIQQLSSQNYQELYRRIDEQTKELTHQYDQLKTKAEGLSYPAFLGQLEKNLSSTDGPRIAYNEKEALRSILQMMNNYLTMEQTEARMKQELNHAQSQLQQPTPNLTSLKGSEIDQVTQSIEKLTIKKTELEQENKVLRPRKRTAKTNSSRAVYTAIITGVVGLISTAVIAGLMLPPLFLLIPATFGLMTFVAILTALAYHIIRTSAKNTLKTNQLTIFDNEVKQFNLKVAKALYEQRQQQIDETEGVVKGTRQKLSEHQMLMDSHFKKMCNVTPSNIGTDSFFPNPATTSQGFPEPPAPPAEEQHRSLGI